MISLFFVMAEGQAENPTFGSFLFLYGLCNLNSDILLVYQLICLLSLLGFCDCVQVRDLILHYVSMGIANYVIGNTFLLIFRLGKTLGCDAEIPLGCDAGRIPQL